jgi:hypothetical protein
MKWIYAVVGLFAAAALLSSCGGGGGGGGGSSSSTAGGGGGGGTTFTLGGLITDSNSNPLSGATVSLDGSSTYVSNTTTSTGAWTISNIPASVIAASSSHTLVVTFGGAQFPYQLPSFAGTSDTTINLTVNTPPPPPVNGP